MGFWAGIKQQFFPLPARYNHEKDTWWGVILTEFPPIQEFYENRWYNLYMLMCTFIFAAFLLFLSHNAVKNGLYDGAYNADSVMKKELDSANARIKVMQEREAQHINDLSALKIDKDSDVRSSNAWKGKYNQAQQECKVLRSTLKARQNEAKDAQRRLDEGYCNKCQTLAAQVSKEVFYRREAVRQGEVFRDRASAAEEQLRNARFDAKVVWRNNQASSSNVDTDRKMRQLAAAVARLEASEASSRTIKTDLTATNARLQASLSSKNAKITSLEASSATIERDHTATVNRLEASLKDKDADITSLEASSATIERDHTSTVNRLEASLKDKDAEITSIEASSRDAERSLTEDITRLEASLTSKNNEIATMEAGSSTNERDATVRIADLVTSLSDRDARIASLEADYLTMEREAIARIAELETSLNDKEATIASMESTSSTIQRDVAANIARLEADRDATLRARESQITRLQREVRKEKDDKDRSRNANDQYRKLNEEYRGTIAQNGKDLVAERQKASQLDKQIIQLNTKVNDLNHQVRKLVDLNSRVGFKPEEIERKRPRPIESDASIDDGSASKVSKGEETELATTSPAPPNPRPQPRGLPDYLQSMMNAPLAPR
ncbi:hypothetical protein P7C71_g4272, partial [Lecanoromycetidae sp. Uapishka_2]